MAFDARMCIFLLFFSAHLALSRKCPCFYPNQCKRITKVRDTEVYFWTAIPKMWKHFDWTRITTLALFTPWDDELMCYAHLKGVRILMATDYPTAKLNNTEERKAWVQKNTEFAVDNFADGINIDIEGTIEKGSKEVGLLTELVKETVDSFKKAIPGSQVTFDVASSPECTPGGRCYDYKALADILDFLIIMAYDETGFARIAGPNSPYDRTAKYVEEYKKLNISTNKLVLGLPWYGYDYTCVKYNITNGMCITNCSTSSPCKKITFSTAQDLLVTRTDFGREWNPTSLSPYFWYYDEYAGVHQVWYDDVYSLSIKYRYALEDQKMKGIAIWDADKLDYGGTKRGSLQTSNMWKILPSVPPTPVGQDIVF